jgi:hypothetical protein
MVLYIIYSNDKRPTTTNNQLLQSTTHYNMPRRSFFMYPVNNLDDQNDEDDFLALWSFDVFDNMFVNFLAWCWTQLKRLWPVLSWLYSASGYYIMWIILHYAAIYLYPEFCAPYTILGFIISPFMVSAPHCIAMRWIISEGSSIIMAMWIAIGGVIINKVMRR